MIANHKPHIDERIVLNCLRGFEMEWRTIFLAPLLLLVILVSSCGESKSDELNKLVAVYMRDNPTDHIRDWSNTYFVSGTVDASKAGLVSDLRVKAIMGCFDWIHSYGNDPQESKFSICIYYIYPVSKASDRIIYNWGDRDRIESTLAHLDFKP
jgi:hypothetical protein